MRYELLTIDANDLVTAANKNITKDGPYYSINLNTNPNMDVTEYREDNALLYQIRKQRGYDNSISNSMKKDLIFIDFSSLFNKLGDRDPADIVNDIENGPTPYGIEDHIQHILNPSQGIQIIFKGEKTPIKFVPFDKSANMAKHCRISYINNQIKKAIDKRLNLDIPFENIKMTLSKWYAYRGLYLTTAERINTNKDRAFNLNKDTVIVIDDKTFRTDNEHLPEETPKEFLVLKNKTPLNDILKGEIHKFEVKKEVIEVNAFDGCGLISPAFSKNINAEMGTNENPASSFQIRMPFCKGVLHETDFHRFIKEDSYIDDENPIIVDYFGIERELNKVQIILTKSMLKASDWIKTYYTDILNKEICKENDPMAYYFEMFNHYDHSLYISGTNLMLHGNGFEYTNYQFLDTLKISQENFQKLINKHFENGEEIIRNNYRTTQPINKNTEENTINKLINAAVLNPAFYNEPQLQYYARKSIANLGIDCSLGRLLISGENRYVSGDLLYFLLHVAKLTGTKSQKKDKNTWANHITLNNNFYMPNPKVKLENDKFYAIMRSPHLSRNEQVALRCYIPPEDSLYNKYFSHLTGVLMLPETPAINYQLSGCDYDGDIIKLFTEELFVNAVLEGGYENGEKILPTVIIPSEKGTEKLQNDKDFIYTIINTFSSKTGLISNLAANFADTEYLYDAPCEVSKSSLCARACAIVGLEIDRAKSGVSCRADIDELIQEEKKRSFGKGKSGTQYFIESKDYLKSLKYKKFRITYNGDYSIVSEDNILNLRQPKGSDHNLVLLPYAFAKWEINTQSHKYISDNEILPLPSEASAYFIFEKENLKYKEADLTDEGINKTIALVKSYNYVLDDIKKYQNNIISNKKISYACLNKVKTNLSIKYDDIDEYRLPGSNILVKDALENAIKLVGSACCDTISAKTVFERLKKQKWQYTTMITENGIPSREDTLFSILDIDKEHCVLQNKELNSAIELITDFSNDGVLILYYLIVMYIKQDASAENIYQYYDANHFKRRYDNYGYYKTLLELYSPNNIPVDADIENVEPDSEESTQIFVNAKWKSDITNKALDLLLQIAGSNDDKPSKKVQRKALEYAHASRKECDYWGSFFWTVIPWKLISSYIYTESEIQ